ncbi:MAG: peptidylprolyl isomerase [Salibacteraceae bacterium]
MNKLTILVVLLLSSSVLFSQDNVLLNISGEVVTTEEFNLVYNKNNSSAQAIDPKTKEEYLDMYINFKLKVKEAESLGMDTAKGFVKELSGYRRQLASPYLTDNNVTESLIREAYDRKKEDVNAWHILIACDADAAPKDTFDAWIQCKKIKEGITNPSEEFSKKAKEFSKDPSAVQNGGDLGYFNVFQMVYPFETAAYNTPKGEISEPVRTRFGYHLLWIKDKRPARGEIRVAHIMVKNNENDTPEESVKNEQKINEIYQKLKAGEKFETLASQYSDDKGSAPKGGELPSFGTGRMVKSFEDAAFSLENDGDYSAPVKTRFGWHIIKRLDKKEVGEYEDLKDELKTKVEKDGRGNKSKDAFFMRAKEEYAFKSNAKSIAAIAALINRSYFERTWKVGDNFMAKNKVVFSLTDKKYKKEKKSWTQRDFAEFVENDKTFQRLPVVDSTVVINKLFDAYVNQKLTEFEDERLEFKYPKFKALVQEYHDGILLFDLMDQKVWGKAVSDSTGLANFFENNKESYKWNKRADAILFSCSDSLVVSRSQSILKAQLDSGINTVKISEALNKESQLSVNINEKKFQAEENSIIDQVDWKVGFSKVIEKDNRLWFVYIKEVLPVQNKTLEEARGSVISGYQDYLEKEWLKELRTKYPVQVFKENLN